MDRKNYIKSPEEIERFINESIEDEEVNRKLKTYLKDNNNIRTLYVVRDLIKKFTE